MNEITRTDLLNYLNNNDIQYSFNVSVQTVSINLTITE